MPVSFGTSGALTSNLPLDKMYLCTAIGKETILVLMTFLTVYMQWFDVLSNNNIHDNWKIFKQLVQEAMNEYIPTLKEVKNLHHPGGLVVSLKPSKLSNPFTKDMFVLRRMLTMFDMLLIEI